MHVAYFTERPYRGLNEDDLLKNHAYFALPNSHFDHIAGRPTTTTSTSTSTSSPRTSASTASPSTSTTATRSAWAP